MWKIHMTNLTNSSIISLVFIFAHKTKIIIFPQLKKEFGINLGPGYQVDDSFLIKIL